MYQAKQSHRNLNGSRLMFSFLNCSFHVSKASKSGVLFFLCGFSCWMKWQCTSNFECVVCIFETIIRVAQHVLWRLLNLPIQNVQLSHGEKKNQNIFEEFRCCVPWKMHNMCLKYRKITRAKHDYSLFFPLVLISAESWIAINGATFHFSKWFFGFCQTPEFNSAKSS